MPQPGAASGEPQGSRPQGSSSRDTWGRIHGWVGKWNYLDTYRLFAALACIIIFALLYRPLSAIMVLGKFIWWGLALYTLGMFFL